ncbi:MAG: CPBP family intramembrane metalloprotease [Anaerolineae bacterium]|nr:CPBP family intramembrane metalloprotease [Anaerolineae bacterium]
MTERTENEAARDHASVDADLPIAWRWLALFFVLAFAITWAILIPTVKRVPQKRQTPFIIAAAFGPFVAATITVRASRGREGLRRWLREILSFRVPAGLYLKGALLLPGLLGGMHYGLYRILGGRADFSSAQPWYFYPAYLIPTALLTGGNEEPGWRGFALPALLTRFSPIVASLILGAIHSVWHLPMLGHYETTLVWYLFNLVPLTFLLNWFYLKSRGSVLPVALLHAGTNVVSTFLPTPDIVLGGHGTWMVLRGIVYWVIAIVLVVATKGALGPPAEAPAAQRLGMQAGKPAATAAE